ncbi:Cation/H(+) antiporter 4 [Linum perenne]
MESQVTWKNETVCYSYPPKIIEVYWGEGTTILDNVLLASLPLLNLQILLIYTISNSLHHCLLKHLRIPSFVSQALTGIILGPTLLGRTDFVKNRLFPPDSQDKLEIIALTGYITFIFLVGVKMDMSMAMSCGKKVMTIGLASVIIPLVVSLAAQEDRILHAENRFVVRQIIGVTSIQSITNFPVVSQLLTELRLTNSEIGRIALSSSLVTGMLGSALQLVATILSVQVGLLLRTVAALMISIMIAVFLFRPAMIWVIKATPQGEGVNPTYVVVIFAAAVAYVILFDGLRQAFSLGPFIFGLVIPSGPPLGSSLVDILEMVPQTVFFPVFVATVAMRADLCSVIFEGFDNRGYFLALICWSAVQKFVASLILALPWMTLIDSIVLSLILCSKGVVDFSIHCYHRDTQNIGVQLFSLFVLAVLINATLIPIVVSFLYEPSRRYAGYHSRNIFALKPFNELRILACIHNPRHHAALVMKFLDTLCRREESAIGLYVIHLMEQVGRDTPVFISHQKQISDAVSCSVDVIFEFDQYERKNVGFTSVHIFTSISLCKFMQEDIWTLALDKLTSIILIPFHRRWSIDGTIECDDHILRALNLRILDNAPCSVGILYDRGNLKHHHRDHIVAPDAANPGLFSRSVCMVYFGGHDDIEAISLAKRMAYDPCVHLTILHMISDELDAATAIGSYDKQVGDLVLKGVLRETCDFPNVQYLGRTVVDGTETARLVTSIADQYDLFIVGRRSNIDMESPQTSGLANWSEFSELGVIGDLLASKDIKTKTSVIVIQQQKQRIRS